MLASLVASIALAVCPPAGPVAPVADVDAPPADALIGCVGDVPIDGARFAHWLGAARKGDGPATPPAVLRQEVMQFLVSGLWLEGETQERGIRVSDRTVRRALTRQKHESFKTERAFREFLRSSGMTRSDLKYRVRLDILSERLRKQVAGKGSPRAQARRLSRFVAQFGPKWSARTSCQDAYAIDDCGSKLEVAPSAR